MRIPHNIQLSCLLIFTYDGFSVSDIYIHYTHIFIYLKVLRRSQACYNVIRHSFTGIRMFLPMVVLAFHALGRKTIESMEVTLARVILL